MNATKAKEQSQDSGRQNFKLDERYGKAVKYTPKGARVKRL